MGKDHRLQESSSQKDAWSVSAHRMSPGSASLETRAISEHDPDTRAAFRLNGVMDAPTETTRAEQLHTEAVLLLQDFERLLHQELLCTRLPKALEPVEPVDAGSLGPRRVHWSLESAAT